VRDALEAGGGDGEVVSAGQKKKNVPTAFIVRAGALRDPVSFESDGRVFDKKAQVTW